MHSKNDVRGLDPLLRPRSVAIVGASDDPGRLAGLTLAYLKKAKFQGEIWPVNPNRQVVQDVRAYPRVADLPAPPDVAIIVVPQALVLESVEACAAARTKVTMVFTTGFSEAGADGAAAQQRLLKIARDAGMRLLGPNCLGCFNAELNFYGTFAIALATGFAKPGNVAVISQSGAYGEQLCYLARKRGLGVRYFVSTGNEVDIDAAEVLSWVTEQPEIDVILAYVEGTRNPNGLKAALRKAHEADKQVVFMKVGRSDAGAASAASHTASLAGDDRVWDAVFQETGVFRAQSTEEQVDVAYVAARRLFPASRKVGIVSVSGGFGIQLCDAADAHGLDVSPLPGPVAKRLRSLLPFGSINNPLDASGQVVSHLDSLRESLALMANEAGYGSVIAFLGTVPVAPSMGPQLLTAMTEIAPQVKDRLVILCLLTESERERRLYEEAGYLVFADGFNAVRALAGVTKLSEGRRRRKAQIALQPPTNFGDKALSEHAAHGVLRQIGIPVLANKLVTSAAEAAVAAVSIGFPVVMKICSTAITHKTEIGGVLLGVADEAAARTGYDLLMKRAREAGYDAHVLDGVMVARMAPKGVEVILGARVDPTFGPVVMFGLGGTFVEVMKDVTIRLAPIDEDEARVMIQEIRAWPLLDGARGAERADIVTLCKALSVLSRFAAANADRVSSIEINPFVLWGEGKGGVALDAVLTLSTRAGARERG